MFILGNFVVLPFHRIRSHSDLKACQRPNFLAISNLFIYSCYYFRSEAIQKNQEVEFERNKERFVFLKVMTDNLRQSYELFI